MRSRSLLWVSRFAPRYFTKPFQKQLSDNTMNKENSMELMTSGHTSPVHGLITSRSVAALPSTIRIVVEASLQKLLTERHFSICTVDAIMEVMNVPRNSQAYKLLHTLHCMDYSSMTKELRETIPLLVREVLIGECHEDQKLTVKAITHDIEF
jgi:hypothetical protein